jgi:TolB-like protein
MEKGKMKHIIIKTIVTIKLLFFATLTISGCGSSRAVRHKQTLPAVFIQPNEPVAVLPFETESVLSNLGAMVSDEVIVNLLQYRPELKIIHASLAQNYLVNAGLNVGGLPDIQKIQSLKAALQCRYLLTGNLFTHLGNVNYTSTFANRIVIGSVTVILVDCDSSQVVWAKRVNASYSTPIYFNGVTTYQTDGELLQGLIRTLGAEVAKNFYEH